MLRASSMPGRSRASGSGPVDGRRISGNVKASRRHRRAVAPKNLNLSLTLHCPGQPAAVARFRQSAAAPSSRPHRLLATRARDTHARLPRARTARSCRNRLAAAVRIPSTAAPAPFRIGRHRDVQRILQRSDLRLRQRARCDERQTRRRGRHPDDPDALQQFRATRRTYANVTQSIAAQSASAEASARSTFRCEPSAATDPKNRPSRACARHRMPERVHPAVRIATVECGPQPAAHA